MVGIIMKLPFGETLPAGSCTVYAFMCVWVCVCVWLRASVSFQFCKLVFEVTCVTGCHFIPNKTLNSTPETNLLLHSLFLFRACFRRFQIATAFCNCNSIGNAIFTVESIFSYLSLSHSLSSIFLTLVYRALNDNNCPQFWFKFVIFVDRYLQWTREEYTTQHCGVNVKCDYWIQTTSARFLFQIYPLRAE